MKLLPPKPLKFAEALWQVRSLEGLVIDHLAGNGPVLLEFKHCISRIKTFESPVPPITAHRPVAVVVNVLVFHHVLEMNMSAETASYVFKGGEKLNDLAGIHMQKGP